MVLINFQELKYKKMSFIFLCLSHNKYGEIIGNQKILATSIEKRGMPDMREI